MVPFYENRQGGFSLSFQRPPYPFPQHLHAQVELAYCVKGEMEVGYGGGVHRLSEGDIALAFAFVPHGYSVPVHRGAEAVILIFAPEYVPDFARVLSNRRPVTPCIRSEGMHPDVPVVMRSLLEEWHGPRDENALRALVCLLMARVMPRVSLAPSAAQVKGDIVHQAMVYIAEHYLERMTLEQVARAVGTSPYHLSHQLSAQLHVGFCQYVNSLRLNEAQLMLKNSNDSILQICYACGFDSPRTFNRAFKQAYGMTPRQMRDGGQNMPAGRGANASY